MSRALASDLAILLAGFLLVDSKSAATDAREDRVNCGDDRPSGMRLKPLALAPTGVRGGDFDPTPPEKTPA